MSDRMKCVPIPIARDLANSHGMTRLLILGIDDHGSFGVIAYLVVLTTDTALALREAGKPGWLALLPWLALMGGVMAAAYLAAMQEKDGPGAGEEDE